MKVFVTGATGYIGGSVALALMRRGHSILGLARNDDKAAALKALGFETLIGSLDDADALTLGARQADAVLNAAHADHADAAETLLNALEGSGKRLIHTSGSSIVGTQAGGERLDPVYDEETPFTPSPGRAPRVALNKRVMAGSDRGLHPVIIAPSLIYGLGHGVHKHSMQIPWLIETARRHRQARHFGPGENLWSNVHIDDLVDLYLLAFENAPSGAFYYAENGEDSMRSLCEAINRLLGHDGQTGTMTLAEAAAEWGEGPAMNTMGSNSRVRAVRARAELGWAPSRPSALHEIEHGCYADRAGSQTTP